MGLLNDINNLRNSSITIKIEIHLEEFNSRNISKIEMSGKNKNSKKFLSEFKKELYTIAEEGYEGNVFDTREKSAKVQEEIRKFYRKKVCNKEYNPICRKVKHGIAK
jgi:hypothetical protein